jgi:hypothetical protein
MVNLVIKGGLHAAVNAAYVRGIKLDTIGQPCVGRETFASASNDHLNAVIAWFCEDGVCEQGNGYPPGTLLHYRA